MKALVRLPVGLKIPAGGHPESDRAGPNGARVFRKWQGRGFKALREKLLRILVGPTGSGKSLLAEALSLDDLLRGHADRVVVAVPQSLIADSFSGGVRMRIPGHRKPVDWEPGHRLIEEPAALARLRAFLTSPLGVTRTNPERILVCSHAALVLYHQKYHSASADWSDYKNVAVVIDEAHHAKCEDDDDGEAGVEDETRNKLGTFVRDWLKAQPGPLTLATATWFRSDRIAIIPPERYEDFAHYTLGIADYLRNLEHLKEIEIRFLAGDPEDCVAQCWNEDPTANTLIYQRPVAAGRDKLQDRERLLRRLKVPRDKFVDLIDPVGRKGRKKELTRSIKAGEWDLGSKKRTKNLVLALQLGREGFDLPALQRSILIGPRSSMQIMEQMVGRLLRDHTGKESVQFNIVLPFAKQDMEDGTLLRDYTKAMMASLALGCVMHPPELAKKKDKKTLDLLTDQPADLADALQGIAENLADDPVLDAEAFVAELIKIGKVPLPKKADPVSAARVLVAILKRQTRGYGEMLAKIPDPDLVTDDFGALRSWRLAFGHGTLTKLSRAVGDYVPFTWESAREAVRALVRSRSIGPQGGP